VGLKLNGTHQLLAYVDDMGDNIVNTDREKTKYMLISRHQNAGQQHNIKIAKRSFENVAQFKYLGMTVTNENLIQEGVKRRLNTCYCSVQKLLCSCLLYIT
jgi:hypothetical protein